MPMILADVQHATQIRQLLDKGRHIFANFGLEDLPTLLEKDLVLLGEDQGSVWGFIGVRREERPPTLPVAAPDRAYLRAFILARGRSPSSDGIQLMDAALQRLQGGPHPVQLIVYGAESWLNKPLLANGFGLAERVQFFRLDLRRQRVTVDSASARAANATPVQLRAMQPTDLDTVAVLDGQTFDPLWHFSAKELWELLFRSRMQVAIVDDVIMGYAALSTNGADAQLARLAVHPQMQGRGIGRLLLLDSIDYARTAHFSTLSLNTQVSNIHAQQLYQKVGFRPAGQIDLVLTKIVP